MTEKDWQPQATLDVLQRRAELLQQIRDFFARRDVLEVDTPVLSRAANTDPNIDSFVIDYAGPDSPVSGQLYLHTSPEFAMKRLLAAGSGPIYQLCKVFRDGEAGRMHNPEFTLLEWYRPGFDHHALMDEVEELLNQLLGINVAFRRITYQQAFIDTTGIDPLTTSVEQCRAYSIRSGPGDVTGLGENLDAWLDLLMDQVVVPTLGNTPVFIFDYPASQAALARLSANDSRVAERFELFISGVELANGFHELTDAGEQRQRFLSDNAQREQDDKPGYPIDENLLQALEHGLPDCAGVALGIERLLMLLTGKNYISDVLAFPISRA